MKQWLHWLGWGVMAAALPLLAADFVVDPQRGSDFGPGDRERPFLTLEKALEHVRARASREQRSDRIFLRGGVYRMTSTATQYWLTLLGRPGAPAVLSAMPAEPGANGAVPRRSGRWYERVVFDDGWRITTPWIPTPGRPGVWETRPGFHLNEWTPDKLKWALAANRLPEQVPGVHRFTLAPYMVLQDDRPTVWADGLEALRTPGDRWYDFVSGTLYLRPFDGRDPNACRLESWYGGPDKNGHLLRDGEGRGLFDGNLEHAEIRGVEFRLLTRTFEFHRRGYAAEWERVRQRHVLFEDNEWRYCFIHLLLDANTVLPRGEPTGDGLIPPAFADRAHWTVRHNLFFRPTKECFQVHGEGHVFEHNAIVEHGGPWAGPAARVGAVNCRNMPGAIIRHNFIWGHDQNQWDAGSVFMIEAQGRSHADAQGDNLFGGQVYEHNVFAGINAGPVLVLGKGGVRMRGITVRYNVFAGTHRGDTIAIASPHQGLRIEHNLFFDQERPIAVARSGALREPARPSTIAVRHNVFVGNGSTINPWLLEAASGSEIEITGNHFHDNRGASLGSAASAGDPRFLAPAALDFRLAPDSPLRRLAPVPGPYAADGSPAGGAEWWRQRAAYPAQPFVR